jgi:hypothetical protein
VSPSPGPGQVVTFYSFKGGTGRSMMLANVAWILASNGCRVLAIDWDLEAPGLHRYFKPFLLDPELEDTDGVIDFVTDYAVAALAEGEPGQAGPDWFRPYADISRYASPLEWDFGGGRLDFVAAGRQGASYSTRVNAFHWQHFYKEFAGGIFIEHMKSAATAGYDYVLVDSRTGVSDTSGICTVQLPSTLVVCFTLNNQSVEGAASVVASVVAKRSDVRILPVPMRIENSEKEKLDLRRTRARRTFSRVLATAADDDPERSWTASEVLYVPYYAYEEILATFGDSTGAPLTMLAAAEQLTERITNGDVRRSVRVSESTRARVLLAYEGTAGRTPRQETTSPGGYVYLSYRRLETHAARRLYDELTRALGPERVLMDAPESSPGMDFVETIQNVVRHAAVVIAMIGTAWEGGFDWPSPEDPDDPVRLELATALATPEVRVVPALVHDAKLPKARDLPDELVPLVRRQSIELSDINYSYDVRRLTAIIELAIADATRAGERGEGATDGVYVPSQGSADVIEKVLQGPSDNVFRRLAREPAATAVLVTSILPVLVLANVIQLDAVTVAAIMLTANVFTAYLLRVFTAPVSGAADRR